MKLRNKKTGEIKEVIVGGYPVSGKTEMWECSEMDMNEETGYKSLGTYTSLAELNEEWEDYEEPKEYWFIRDHTLSVGYAPADNNATAKFRKEIVGNYFETKEEAEKAVEKLKAFKRMQDLGFRFEGVRFRNNHSYIEWKIEPKNGLTDNETGELLESLYKVFGGTK